MAKKVRVQAGTFKRLGGAPGPLKIGEAFEVKFGGKVMRFRPVKNFSKESKHARA